jgi:hypothetical protein
VVDRRRDILALEDVLPQVSLIWGRSEDSMVAYSATPSSLHFVANLLFWILGAEIFLEVSFNSTSWLGIVHLEIMISWWEKMRGFSSLHSISIRVSLVFLPPNNNKSRSESCSPFPGKW